MNYRIFATFAIMWQKWQKMNMLLHLLECCCWFIARPRGGGLISRNNTIKGVIKCLLPVARLRDVFATRARPEMAILRLWSRRDG